MLNNNINKCIILKMKLTLSKMLGNHGGKKENDCVKKIKKKSLFKI